MYNSQSLEGVDSRSDESSGDGDGGYPIIRIQIDEYLCPLHNQSALNALVTVQSFLCRVYGSFEAALFEDSYCHLRRHSRMDFLRYVFFAAGLPSSPAG